MFTREDFMCKGKGNREKVKPVDSSIVMHTDRECPRMKDAKPLMIHALTIKKINWCFKCRHKRVPSSSYVMALPRTRPTNLARLPMGEGSDITTADAAA